MMEACGLFKHLVILCSPRNLVFSLCQNCLRKLGLQLGEGFLSRLWQKNTKNFDSSNISMNQAHLLKRKECNHPTEKNCILNK